MSKRSLVEIKALMNFATRFPTHQGELERQLAQVLLDRVGTYDVPEFFENDGALLPQLVKIYPGRFGKVGLRALHYIGEALRLDPEERPGYFRSAIQRDEERYQQQSPRRILSDVVAVTKAVIRQHSQPAGSNHPGVVAAIMYGSGARKDFYPPESDIDIAFVQNSEESTYRNPNFGEVSYDIEVRGGIDMVIKPELDNHYGSLSIKSPDIIKHLTHGLHVMRPPHIVISPYPEIRRRVEDILRES